MKISEAFDQCRTAGTAGMGLGGVMGLQQGITVPPGVMALVLLTDSMRPLARIITSYFGSSSLDWSIVVVSEK